MSKEKELEKKYYELLKEVYMTYEKRQKDPGNKELYDKIKSRLKELEVLLQKEKIPNVSYSESLALLMNLYRLNESLLFRITGKNDFKK